MSVNKKKREKVCMKTNDRKRLVRETGKKKNPPSCFECEGPSRTPRIRPSFPQRKQCRQRHLTCVVTSLPCIHWHSPGWATHLRILQEGPLTPSASQGMDLLSRRDVLLLHGHKSRTSNLLSYPVTHHGNRANQS